MGTWAPYWANAFFEEPLLYQCIAIIQQYQPQALATINAYRAQYGNPPLDPINEFHLGAAMRTVLPWLTLALRECTFDTDEDQHRVCYPRFDLVLDVGQFDQELCQTNAANYARMLDQIITTAQEVVWETPLPIRSVAVPSGMTKPNLQGTVSRIWVEAHNYGAVELEEIQTPVMRVTLPLVFQLNEDIGS
jgi:hypothetical protein